MISKTELSTYNYVLYFPILSFILTFIFNLFYDIDSLPDSPHANFYIKPGCFFIQIILFALFVFSALQINKLLKGKNSKLFISLAKCTAACSLIAIYFGFYLINAHSTNDIINNIIVLITSLFFFIDGSHDMYAYIEPKKLDINTKYIKKRAITYEILYLLLFNTVSITFIILVCYLFKILFNTNYNLVVSLLSFICLFFDFCILPFKSVFINIIASENSSDIKQPNNELPKKYNFIIRLIIGCSIIVLLVTSLYYLHTSVILLTLPLLLIIILIAIFNFTRNWLFDTIINKIFVEVNFINYSEVISTTKDFYYNQYIKSKPNMILLSDLKSTDCIWYNIVNKTNNFLGDAFILNKNDQSYLFVFIINSKRGQGFGSIALNNLKQKPEVKYKDIFIQVNYNNDDICLIKTMLTNNNFIEVITETPEQSDIS